MAHELGEAKVEWEILFIAGESNFIIYPVPITVLYNPPPPPAPPVRRRVGELDVATRAPFRFEGERWGSTSGSALRLRERAGVPSNEPIDLSARWGFRVDT